MKKKYVALIVLAIVVCFLVFLYAISLSPEQSEDGFLEGKVTIGPISPVEREGEPASTPPEVYEARKIIVKDNASRKTLEVDLDSNGNYKVALKPGAYIVDINYVGIDHSDDVPSQIVIESGKTTYLNIDIDTGIR